MCCHLLPPPLAYALTRHTYYPPRLSPQSRPGLVPTRHSSSPKMLMPTAKPPTASPQTAGTYVVPAPW